MYFIIPYKHAFIDELCSSTRRSYLHLKMNIVFQILHDKDCIDQSTSRVILLFSDLQMPLSPTWVGNERNSPHWSFAGPERLPIFLTVQEIGMNPFRVQ